MTTDSASPSPFGGQRLWMIVAGLVVLGLIIAGAGWWWMHRSSPHAAASNRPKLIGEYGQKLTALDDALPDSGDICAAGLKRALDFGALPAGVTLANSSAEDAQPEGHMTCQAQGAEGHYTLTIDTLCADGKAKSCFALDAIRRDDGQVLYKRRPYLPASKG